MINLEAGVVLGLGLAPSDSAVELNDILRHIHVQSRLVMPGSKPNSDSIDVLRKIGRNVVVLQKIEGLLKKLVTIQGLSGTIDKPELIQKRVKSVAKRPMGHLVAEFLQKAYVPLDDRKSKLDGQSVPTISVSFELDEDLRDAHKESLSSIVKERNNLIHDMLIEFKPDSDESCRHLSDALDSQLDRVLPEYRLLSSLLLSIRASLFEMQEYADSDQFISDLGDARE